MVWNCSMPDIFDQVQNCTPNSSASWLVIEFSCAWNNTQTNTSMWESQVLHLQSIRVSFPIQESLSKYLEASRVDTGSWSARASLLASFLLLQLGAARSQCIFSSAWYYPQSPETSRNVDRRGSHMSRSTVYNVYLSKIQVQEI